MLIGKLVVVDCHFQFEMNKKLSINNKLVALSVFTFLKIKWAPTASLWQTFFLSFFEAQTVQLSAGYVIEHTWFCALKNRNKDKCRHCKKSHNVQ